MKFLRSATVLALIAATPAGAQALSCDQQLAPLDRKLDILLDQSDLRLEVAEPLLAEYEQRATGGRATLEGTIFARMLLQANCDLLQKMLVVTAARVQIAALPVCASKPQAAKDTIAKDDADGRKALPTCTNAIQKTDAAIARLLMQKK